MKTLAWILTAAAVLVGADVFVMSSETTTTSIATDGTTDLNGEIQFTGSSGIPTPPPDAHE
jgi:hypothetical protein